MFQAKSPGAGLFRLSLTGVVCLSLAASSWAQDTKSERIPVEPKAVQGQNADQTSTPPVKSEKKWNGQGGREFLVSPLLPTTILTSPRWRRSSRSKVKLPLQ